VIDRQSSESLPGDDGPAVSADVPSRRGPYRRGRETREEIQRAAFAAFSEQGFRAVSIRSIAQRVGLTQQGVMHHFGSKEQLLAEVLALRDEDDLQQIPLVDTGHPVQDFVDRVRRIVAYNARRPGIVRLFSALSVEAADREHPAHDYFVTRYRTLIDSGAHSLEAAGAVPAGIDAEMAARLILAVMDGLQIQWQLESDLSMEPAIDAFLALLVAAADGPPAEPHPVQPHSAQPHGAPPRP
jgi:AcrR family transcriptional regulator